LPGPTVRETNSRTIMSEQFAFLVRMFQGISSPVKPRTAIEYVASCEGVTPERLEGFFTGWSNAPSPELHLKLLRNSDRVILAIDTGSGDVVGFVTAVTDETLFAYIPLLEVLPEYRGCGIGTELMRRILAELDGLYAVDLLCDAGLQPFYERLGMMKAAGMMRRDYRRQSGE
jgi:ribosomal protein S18 acetylase RimI-like enzyme